MRFDYLTTQQLYDAAHLAVLNMRAIKPEYRDGLQEKYRALITEANRRNWNVHTDGKERKENGQ